MDQEKQDKKKHKKQSKDKTKTKFPEEQEESVDASTEQQEHDSTAKTTATPAPTSFMDYFWDLASERDDRRLTAANSLISFLLKKQDTCSNTLSNDGEYTLKRLVKGLSSSREQARLGFSTCLTQFLKTFPFVNLDEVMNLLEDVTKITGSVRGADERDMLFGKLFGYIAFLESGRVDDKEELLLQLFEKLVALFDNKIWLREVTSEVILSCLNKFKSKSSWEIAANKLKGLVLNDLSDYAAYDVVLVSGIQFMLNSKPELKEIITGTIESFPTETIISTNNLEEIGRILIAACAGFPKIHRIWHCVFLEIFGSSHNRELPSTRITQFNSENKSNLFCKLVEYVETHMLSGNTSTNEKKCVAFNVFQRLLEVAPLSHLSYIVNKPWIRCVMSILKNKSHTLRNYCIKHMKNVVTIASDSAETRTSVVSLLLQNGGANFDSITSTSTMADLLKDINDASNVQNIIISLCKLIVNNCTSISDDSNDISVATGAINTLSGLPKMLSTERSSILTILIALLIRIAYFEKGTFKITNNKKGNKPQGTSDSPPIDESILKNVTGIVNLIDPIYEKQSIPQKVRELAASKVFSLVMESVSENEGDNQTRQNKHCDVALKFLVLFMQSGLKLWNPIITETTVTELQTKLLGFESKLAPYLYQFFGLSLFHILSNNENDELLEDLLNVINLLVDDIRKDSLSEEDNCLHTFYQISMALLSENLDAQQSAGVKALRHSLKQCWKGIFINYGKLVTHDLVDAMVMSVVGEDGFDATEGDDDEDLEDEADISGDDSEQDDEAVEGGSSKQTINNENSSKKSHKNEREVDESVDSDDDSKEEEGEDDEKNDDDNPSDEEIMISADEALSQMIQMRKQSRKHAVVQGKRVDMINRCRAIDIIDLYLSRNEDPETILPMFSPFLKCYSKVFGSSIIQNIEEGRNFTQKLKVLIESKLNKSKLRLPKEGDDASHKSEDISTDSPVAKDNITAYFVDALQSVSKYLRVKDANIRNLAAQSFFCLARKILSGNFEDLKKALQVIVDGLFTVYYQKKNSRVSTSLLDELLSRFTEFTMQVSLKTIVTGCQSGLNDYATSEAFRHLHFLIKRFSSFPGSSKQLLFSNANDILQAFSATIEQLVEGTLQMKSARSRTIILCCHDLINLFKKLLSSSEQQGLTSGALVKQYVNKNVMASLQVVTSKYSEVSSLNSSMAKILKEVSSTILTMSPSLNNSSLVSTQKKKRDVTESQQTPDVNEVDGEGEEKGKKKKAKKGKQVKSREDELIEQEEKKFLVQQSKQQQSNEVVTTKSKQKKQRSEPPALEPETDEATAFLNKILGGKATSQSDALEDAIRSDKKNKKQKSSH